MKLELKYFTLYLSYGLKVLRYDKQFFKGYVIHNVIGLTEDFRYKKEDLDPDDSKDLLKLKQITFWLDEGYGINNIVYDVKPILRSLSDLRKEEFNYLHTLLRVHVGKNKRDKLINEGYGITDLPYFIVEQLLENHFDVYGLIPQGLAVDFNTLEIGS